MDSIANFSQPNTFHYCQLGNLLYSHISKEAVRRMHNYVYWIVSGSQLLRPMQHQKNEENERYMQWYIPSLILCLPSDIPYIFHEPPSFDKNGITD